MLVLALCLLRLAHPESYKQEKGLQALTYRGGWPVLCTRGVSSSPKPAIEARRWQVSNYREAELT